MNKIIALDIGATNMRFALIDEKFNILKSIIKPTIKNDKTGFLKMIKENVLSLLSDVENIICISIGVPGYVNSRQIIEELPNINLKNIDIISYLNDEISIPIYIINDAVAAGYAEAIHGAGKNYKTAYYMTISSGVGGACFKEGQEIFPLRENGHSLIVYKGNHYDAEHLLSGYGLVRLSSINNYQITSSRQFFENLSNGDTIAKEIYLDWLTLFKQFFCLLDNIYDADVYVIGGGVTSSSASFFDDLKQVIDKDIVLAHFSLDVGLIGSAVYGFLKENKYE